MTSRDANYFDVSVLSDLHFNPYPSCLEPKTEGGSHPKKTVGAGRKGRNRNREVEMPSDEQRCNLGRTGKRLERDPWIS